MLADCELTGIVTEKPCAFMLLPSAPVAIVTGGGGGRGAHLIFPVSAPMSRAPLLKDRTRVVAVCPRGHRTTDGRRWA
jgi:hypothetical protein